MFFVDRERDPPVKRRTRDADVLQAPLDQADHFVTSNLREDEFRVPSIVFQQLVLVGRELKEVVLLLQPLGFGLVVGTDPFHQVLFGKKGLAGFAVPAFVGGLVDIPCVEDGFKKF